MIDEKKLIEELDYYISHTPEDSSGHYAYKRAKALIDRQPKVGEWIPVSERLPEDSRDVIVTTRSRTIGVGSYLESGDDWVQWYSDGGIGADVFVWQPLPEPFKWQCSRCGQDVVSGYKLCAECLEDVRKRVLNGRANVDREKHPWKADQEAMWRKKQYEQARSN